MFQLTAGETSHLKLQFAISSERSAGEQQLSKSVRAFVKLRQTLDTNRELASKFAELEQRVGKHDVEISATLDAIRQLMTPPEKSRREIGFHVREKEPRYRTPDNR
jgi:hypothetical protein